MRTFLKIAALLLSLAILSVLVWQGYEASWTGFQGYQKTKDEYVPKKMLWDWLQLLVIPTVLALAAFFLNRIQKETETRQTLNQQQETALQTYLTQMSELMLKEKLRESKEDAEVRTIARARTLSALREMDGKRKGVIVRFLIEAKLITLLPSEDIKDRGFSIIDLDGADLIGADLTHFDFNGTVFYGTNLLGADFRYSQLKGAEYFESVKVDEKWDLVWKISNSISPFRENDALCGKDLREANLCGGSLKGLDLSGTDLRGADLSLVNLAGTRVNRFTRMDKKWWFVWKVMNEEIPAKHLKGADLRSAFLRYHYFADANLQNADLSNADLSSSQFPSADFTQAKLHFTVMEDSDLKGATFDMASTIGIKAKGAQLPASKWRNIWLWDCDFRGANLQEADFNGSTLEDLNLSGADLSGAKLPDVKDVKNLTWDSDTKWPNGFVPPKSVPTHLDRLFESD